MTRLQDADDVQFVRTDAGVLELRGRVNGAPAWSLAIDVAGLYGERLARPEAFAIDARMTAGELHLIVHAWDAAAPVLLPPRELTICDGPRLERSRPGIDRYALDAARFVFSGGISWEVRDETATDYELAGGRRIAKSDRSLAGPYLRLVVHAGWTIRIVQELERHVLAVVHHSAGRSLGWSIATTDEGEPVGYRWFERAELGFLKPIAAADPCTVCEQATGEHRPGVSSIDVDRSGEHVQRIVECGRCLATYVVTETGAGAWTWTLRSPRRREATHRPIQIERPAPTPPPTVERPVEPKLAPAPAPAPAPAAAGPPAEPDKDGWIYFGERHVRVESRSATTFTLLVVASETDATLVAAGFTAKECYGGGSWVNDYEPTTYYEHRLVIDQRDPRLSGDGKPAPRATAALDWPSGAPPLDDDLRGELEPHTYLHGPYSRLRITAESSDSFTLAGGAGPILVLKGDPKYAGHHRYYVRHAGHLLRVARELPTHVLAICHASFGTELGFATLARSGTESLAGAWLARSSVERADMEPPATPAPTPDQPSSYDKALMSQATETLAVGGRRLHVESETADRFVVETSLGRAQEPALVADGWVETTGYDDYYGAPEYEYRLDCAKTDPRISGVGELVAYRGYQLRVAGRRNGRVLLIAHHQLAAELGFERHISLAYRWIPESEVRPVR